MNERSAAARAGTRATAVEVEAPWGWDDAHRKLVVAIVGATGAVGRELAGLLADAEHPFSNVEARARRSGAIELGRGRKLDVRPLEADVERAHFARWDLAFLCTPSELSLTLAPQLIEAGVHVIDLSSAHRMLPHVPLVVPEINADALELAHESGGPRLIANPNCTTAIAALPLAVIDRAARLSEVVVVSFQAASGAGLAGLEALARESSANQSDASRAPATSASPFPAVLALNVIPAVADVDRDGISGEEHKVMDETRRILGRPDLSIEVTTTRVPVERCHSVAVHVRTERELSPADLTDLLKRAPGIAVTADVHGPRPRECAGTNPVHVGRIRRGTRGSRSLCFFAVGDQLRKGAALNALQVAAMLPLPPARR
jgi:aspartate-semialdehyde dehydrogenase